MCTYNVILEIKGAYLSNYFRLYQFKHIAQTKFLLDKIFTQPSYTCTTEISSVINFHPRGKGYHAIINTGQFTDFSYECRWQKKLRIFLSRQNSYTVFPKTTLGPIQTLLSHLFMSSWPLLSHTHTYTYTGHSHRLYLSRTHPYLIFFLGRTLHMHACTRTHTYT